MQPCIGILAVPVSYPLRVAGLFVRHIARGSLIPLLAPLAYKKLSPGSVQFYPSLGVGAYLGTRLRNLLGSLR